MNRIKNEVIAEENDSKDDFELRAKYFLRDAKNKGYLQICGNLAMPRFYEITEIMPGTYSMAVSITNIIVDFETIRKLKLLGRRYKVFISSIEHRANRWACVLVQDDMDLQ